MSREKGNRLRGWCHALAMSNHHGIHSQLLANTQACTACFPPAPLEKCPEADAQTHGDSLDGVTYFVEKRVVTVTKWVNHVHFIQFLESQIITDYTEVTE